MPLDKIRGMIAFATPLRVISRPERLIVQDYRPTTVMLLAGVGVGVFAVFFFLLLLRGDAGVDSFGLWATGIVAVACLAACLRGTLREVYIFDRPSDSYTFVRQFIHRKETIEGALTQFTGARVETHHHENGESYTVVLRQEGMFLTGVAEQTLREEVPVLNSYTNETRIADAIARFLIRSRP